MRHWLIRRLADGEFHSGADLAAAAGVSRAAIWKHVRALTDIGFEVFAVRGKGYRLAEPAEFLDSAQIVSAIDAEHRPKITSVQVEFEANSTNDLALARARTGCLSGLAILAEYQVAGKGRRGRNWISPAGKNIYLSVLWRMAEAAVPLEGLSLAVGTGVARAICELGCDVKLKWPNDIYWMGRKVAGILIEMFGEATGPATVVVGVGINVKIPDMADVTIDQPWIDLESIIGEGVPRNLLAGRVLSEMARSLSQFERCGFESFVPDFKRFDFLAGQCVTVKLYGRELVGEAMGVDQQGALWVDVGGTPERFFSGDVSIRVSS